VFFGSCAFPCGCWTCGFCELVVVDDFLCFVGWLFVCVWFPLFVSWVLGSCVCFWLCGLWELVVVVGVVDFGEPGRPSGKFDDRR
jgi:hypothetical protein